MILAASLVVAAAADWLIDDTPYRAKAERQGDRLVISNGLVRRTILLKPNAATVELRHETTGENFLRAVRPEASFTVDGAEFAIGGLVGQPNHAYLAPEWLDKLTADPNAMAFRSVELGKTKAPFAWKHVRHSEGRPWPAPGVRASFHFAKGDLEAIVHYELYDGCPVMGKWVTLRNRGQKAVRVDRFVADILAFPEPESFVDASTKWQDPNFEVITDYAFGGMSLANSTRTVEFATDPDYATQVNYERKTPCLLKVRPPYGPGVDLAAGETFETFRSFMIFHDSTERERRGPTVRRAVRTLAPWVTENPIMLHLTSTDPKVVMPAIDQAADCGFEMIVISFWSGLDMEDVSAANIAKIRAFREYANKKGVELGGYSLLASRHIDAENDIVNPKPIFGASPCLLSKWGLGYFERITKFIDETGFQLLEHDGSYPGDTCASTQHPGHRDFEDSQWLQYQKIADFYRQCRSQGVFLNVPDTYFLVGSNKTGMGYRESNWSLPRIQQHIHARQNLFDGTWTKTPTMGWMMTPLVEYQGGGKEATIEPLREHLDDYEQHLANNFGYGAQSCYRGPRLYDSPETLAVVRKWVNWFKAHRDILESDVVHLRRADGQRIDGILHINPKLKIKGLAMFYNPSDRSLEEDFSVPLYYSGLRGKCSVRVDGGTARRMSLDGLANGKLKVSVGPRSRTWVTFE